MTYLWKYTPQEVAELVRAPKRSREGPVLEFKKKRDSTREMNMSFGRNGNAGTTVMFPHGVPAILQVCELRDLRGE